MMRFFNILIMMIIISCSAKKTSDLGTDTHIYLVPEVPIKGQKFKIYYNQNNKNAIYKRSDTLFATIEIKDSYDTKRFRLQLSKVNDVFETEFLLPNFGHTLEIMITPNEVYRSMEGITVAILEENGNISKGCLPNLMLMSSDFDEIKEYFQMDSELYPNDYCRTFALWDFMVKNQYDVKNITEDSDSLFNYLILNSSSLNYDDLCNGLLAVFFIFNQNKDWNKIDEILSIIENNHNGRLPLLLYIYGFDLFFENLMISEKSIFNKFSKKIKKLTQIDTSLYIESLFLRNSKEFDFKYYNDDFYRLTKTKLFKLFNSDYTDLNYDNYISIIFDLIDYNISRQKYKEVIEIADLTLKKYDILFNRNFWDNMNINVPVGPLKGHKGILIGYKYDAQLKLGDTINAIKTIHNYVQQETDITEYNKGSLSLSAIKLCDIYLNQDDIANAIESVKLAIELGSPFAKERFDKLEKMLISNKLKPLGIEFFNKYNIRRFIDLSKSEIDFLNQFIKISGLRDTTIFIFFLDDNCFACNFGYFEAIDTLKSVKDQSFRIIVVSQLDKKELDPYFANYIIIRNTLECSVAFNIDRFPALIVIKKNKIIEKTVNITTNKSAYIELLKVIEW